MVPVKQAYQLRAEAGSHWAHPGWPKWAIRRINLSDVAGLLRDAIRDGCLSEQAGWIVILIVPLLTSRAAQTVKGLSSPIKHVLPTYLR